MDKIMLFKASISASDLINGGGNFDLEVNSYEFMTVEEQKKFSEALNVATSCVRNAMVRRVNESEEGDSEDDE